MEALDGGRSFQAGTTRGSSSCLGLQGKWEDDPAEQAVYRTLHLPYILLVAMFASVAAVTAIKARLKFSLRTLFIVLTLSAVPAGVAAAICRG